MKVNKGDVEKSLGCFKGWGLNQLPQGFCICYDYNFFFLAVSKSPQTMTANVQQAFIRLWSKTFPLKTKTLPGQLISLLSLKNVRLLELSRSKRETFDRLEHFLYRILKSGLLTPVDLEEMALVLSGPGQEWSEVSTMDYRNQSQQWNEKVPISR